MIVNRLIGPSTPRKSDGRYPARDRALSTTEIAEIQTVGVGGLIHIAHLYPVARSVIQHESGVVLHTIMKLVRSLPTPTLAPHRTRCTSVDRVNGVLATLSAVVAPRSAAAVSAARTLLGAVVRDAGWLRSLLDTHPSDAYGRRAVILALALLGETVPLERTLRDPSNPLDVAATCLASVLAWIAPKSELATVIDPATHTPGVVNERLAVSPGDIAEAAWHSMQKDIRAIETRVLEVPHADAAFDVASHALKRVRERCWWLVIDT
ncbi:MAG: hypothetical protein ACO1Q7_00780 [Gemmatimonas sp.]